MTAPPEPSTPEPSKPSPPPPRALEAIVAHLLTGMTALAGLVALLGLVTYLRRPAGAPDIHAFAPSLPSSIRGLAQGLRSFEPRSIMALGVLLLLLTPVARVAILCGSFLVRRDWLYVALAGLVLAALSAAIFGGARL